MPASDTFPRLTLVLRKVFGDKPDIRPETKLWDLAPDSIEIQALMLEMIEEFDTQVPWEEVKVGKVVTVQDAVDYLDKQLTERCR